MAAGPAIQWVPVFDTRLPYPVSANRYWRHRIIPPKIEDGRYRFKELLQELADGKTPDPDRVRATLADIPEGFVSVYLSGEAKAFREMVAWIVSRKIKQPLTGRVRVDLQLMPHCPKDWRQRWRKDPLWWADTVGRVDVDNCHKVAIDAMKGIVYTDDRQVWKTSSEILEPEPEQEESLLLRICRGVKDESAVDTVRQQQVLSLEPPPPAPRAPAPIDDEDDPFK